MKAVITAIILLVTVTSLVIINSIALGRIFDNIFDGLSQIDTEDLTRAKEEYERIFDYYKGYSKYISLSVKHSELRNIEDCFYELIGACESESSSDIPQIKSRLIGALSHTRRLAGINIDSVL